MFASLALLMAAENGVHWILLSAAVELHAPMARSAVTAAAASFVRMFSFIMATLTSLALKIHTFQVARLLESGWMIRRIFGASKFNEFVAGGDFGNEGEEFVGRDVGGAGGGDKDAVGAEPWKGGGGELAIGAKCSGFFGCAFGEGGRVENDEFELARGFLGEPFEGVGLDGFVGCGDGWVEREVAAGAFEGVGANVEVGDGFGVAARGVEAEAAAEAEGVEDVAIAGESFDDLTVLALVEEKAGFLAAEDVGFEANVVLAKDDGAVEGRAMEDFGAVGKIAALTED